jgi:hypothetical protein
LAGAEGERQGDFARGPSGLPRRQAARLIIIIIIIIIIIFIFILISE